MDAALARDREHRARRPPRRADSFESLYSYLIAPAWWIHSTADAYAAIKYLNAVVCASRPSRSTCSRGPCSTRRAAVAVALLSIAIPAMSYATSIVPEPLAYLVVHAAASRRCGRLRRAAAWPIVARRCCSPPAGPLVRHEFVVLPASLVLAAAVPWSPGRGNFSWRRVPRRRGPRRRSGSSSTCSSSSGCRAGRSGEYFNRHTLTEGGLAGGALVMGSACCR